MNCIIIILFKKKCIINGPISGLIEKLIFFKNPTFSHFVPMFLYELLLINFLVIIFHIVYLILNI
jgi:hypothetical protein